MPAKPKPRRKTPVPKVVRPGDPYEVLAKVVQFLAGMEADGALRLPYGGYREMILVMEKTAHGRRPKPSKVPR